MGRIETVSGEDRGTWGVLVSALSVGVVAAVVAGFVAYRMIYTRPAVPVSGNVEGSDPSTGGQERDTES